MFMVITSSLKNIAENYLISESNLWSFRCVRSSYDESSFDTATKFALVVLFFEKSCADCCLASAI